MTDIEAERQEYNDSLASLYEEIERLRSALQDAKDLARYEAPAQMIVNVCERALSSERAKDE